MKKLCVYIVSVLTLSGCAEIEFSELDISSSFFKVKLVQQTSALANGTGKALLQLQVSSNENIPLEGVYFKPESTNETKSMGCTTSNRNGLISCHYTSKSPGKYQINLTRGKQILDYSLIFLPVSQNYLNLKTASSKSLKLNEFGYQINSNISNTQELHQVEFGYKISTNINL